MGVFLLYRTINFRLPACRSAAAVGAAAALAAGAALAAAPAVQAAPAAAHDEGASTATVLRADLDVSLLHRTADVPVNASLDDVRAPGDAKETALTVTVGHGVEPGRGTGLLRAGAATADATAGHGQAQGSADIADATVHVPGLPLLPLIALDAASSRATCRAGQRPTASSHLVGVTVLGRRVSLKAVGATKVSVPGVGEVSLTLTDAVTTSHTAAAAALRLALHVDPLSLGVAAVSGDVTLAQATCRTPNSGGGSTGGSGGTSGGSGGSAGGSTGGAPGGGSASGGSANGGSTGGGSGSGGSAGGSTSGVTGGSTHGATGGSTSGSSGSSGSGGGSGGSSGGSSSGGPHTGTQTVADTGNLAETGAGSSAPYLAAGAAALVAAGAAAFAATGGRRKSAASRAGSGS